MNKQSILKRRLPMTPGVYFFKGLGGRILYIGKATSLRDRVKSYFSSDIASTRGPLIIEMLAKAKSISWQTTDSVLEALLLEAHLIGRHKPPYNTEGKDDKSFNYVVITKENFSRVLLVRGKELTHNLEAQNVKQKASGYKLQASYGPFPKGGALKEALRIIRKIFPYRDRCIPISELKPGVSPRSCFNRQIGLCPGVCTGEISKADYAKRIKEIKLFFEGKKKILLLNLKREMKQLAKVQEFERAKELKYRLFALTHIQDVSLLKREIRNPNPTFTFRIEAYDVAHISGTSMVGVMTVVEDGEVNKDDYRRFKIRTVSGSNDPAALTEVIERRLGHDDWPLPSLFVIDGGRAQKRAAEKVLKKCGVAIPVVAVVKDEFHRPKAILGTSQIIKGREREILLANSESHRFAVNYHRKLRSPV